MFSACWKMLHCCKGVNAQCIERTCVAENLYLNGIKVWRSQCESSGLSTLEPYFHRWLKMTWRWWVLKCEIQFVIPLISLWNSETLKMIVSFMLLYYNTWSVMKRLRVTFILCFLWLKIYARHSGDAAVRLLMPIFIPTHVTQHRTKNSTTGRRISLVPV